MKKNILLVFFVLAFAKAYSQKATLSGTVTEAATSETLLNVNVIIKELKTGTITNEYGYYSINLPVGSYTVQFTSLGFTSQEKIISLNKDTVLDIALDEANEELETIVIKADVEKLNTRSPQMSVNALNIDTVKKIPVVLGETDLIKALTLLPGVSNAGEGAAGFNVRGGAADQNLVLLDEATLYGSDHLFGFFSVFNPDAIKDLKLYKGGIPARYGGRVSSVLEISK